MLAAPVIVSGVSPLVAAGTLTDAQLRQVDESVAAWRKLSIALLVLGIVGLIPTFSWVSDILAIAAGAIGLGAAKRDVLLSMARGGAAPSSAPIHGYNCCIALSVFASVNFFYCIILTIANAHGGSRALEALFVLGVLWSAAFFGLAFAYMARFNRLRALLGLRIGAGGCCDTTPPPPHPGMVPSGLTTTTYIISPSAPGSAGQAIMLPGGQTILMPAGAAPPPAGRVV